jgi:2-hydroxy-6-oxonona-2,4-dienedioate hydrolase
MRAPALAAAASLAVASLAAAAASVAGAVAAARLLRRLRRPAGMHVRHDRIAGLRIRALVGGPSDGVPVVLVHGLGVSGAYMVPTAQRLAKRMRVHVPDLPGHGLSDRPGEPFGIVRHAGLLARWMEAVGLRRAIVVGNSMGCQIAVELAAADPQRVAALVLVGPTADARARTMPRHLLRLVAVAPFERPSLHVVLAVDYLRLGPRSFLAEVRSMLAHRIECRIPREVPTWIVRGERDRIAPHPWAARLARIAGTPLATIPRCAHAVNYGAPDELARVVARIGAALRERGGV